MYVEGFSSKLKKARANTGFTQREVAKELGIAQSVLARYETGKGEPSIETIGLLIDFYQISADWLFGTGSINQNREPKQKTERPNVKLIVSCRDNYVNDGNMYIELTPEQMRKIKEATE